MNIDDYSSSSTYLKGDYCIYNNKLQKANQNINTAEAFNSSHWDETTIEAELGILNKMAGIPTNSVIDYDGNTVPSGFEEIVDAGVQYPTYTNGQDVGTDRRSYYYKQGNVVFLTINVTGIALSSGGSKVLFTLPEGYRPVSDTFTLTTHQGGTSVMNTRVKKTTGVVEITYSSGTVPSSGYIFANMTFCVE